MEGTIQASDLRIGNYVYYRIQDELDERKDWFEISKIDANDLVILEASIDYDFKPIPLTEDILLKCGFERKEIYLNDFFIKGITLHFSNGNCNWGSVKIKYLHQLQNLYFALTNTELEIQL